MRPKHASFRAFHYTAEINTRRYGKNCPWAQTSSTHRKSGETLSHTAMDGVGNKCENQCRRFLVCRMPPQHDTTQTRNYRSWGDGDRTEQALQNGYGQPLERNDRSGQRNQNTHCDRYAWKFYTDCRPVDTSNQRSDTQGDGR